MSRPTTPIRCPRHGCTPRQLADERDRTAARLAPSAILRMSPRRRCRRLLSATHITPRLGSPSCRRSLRLREDAPSAAAQDAAPPRHAAAAVINSARPRFRKSRALPPRFPPSGVRPSPHLLPRGRVAPVLPCPASRILRNRSWPECAPDDGANSDGAASAKRTGGSPTTIPAAEPQKLAAAAPARAAPTAAATVVGHGRPRCLRRTRNRGAQRCQAAPMSTPIRSRFWS